MADGVAREIHIGVIVGSHEVLNNFQVFELHELEVSIHASIENQDIQPSEPLDAVVDQQSLIGHYDTCS